jgi:hypothetical protein
MANPKKIIGGLKAAGKRLLAEPAPAYSPKLLESTTAKFADKIADANPKLTDEEVLKKATAQATKKLEWERVQKPALEKRYGALGKASFAESNPNKMQNTAEVVAERKRKANEFLSQPTEPWTPPRKELQAFDRASIKDALEGFPDVEQSSFPRDMPTRASTSHVEELYSDPENRALIAKQIKRGLPLGGETFYGSLYPVKQAVQEAGIPAEKFDKWIHSLAPASARNSIMNEMAVGQFLRNMNARGIPLTEENVAREMAVYKEKFGIGLPLMPIHRQGVANVLEGGINLRDQNLANIPTNYKIPTYGTQKAGDFAKSAVLDVHEAGGHTQGSRFHPYFNEQGGFGNTEYGAGEQGLLGIAQDLGIPGGMAQAGRWFGGGELTGLKSPRGDALDLLEKQVAYTLKQKGVQPNPANVRAEVLKQIETGEGDLLPWYRKEGMPDVRETGLQRAEGGEVDGDQELKAMIADHLESQRDDPELRSMIEGYMAGGEVGMADGGKMVKGATKAFKKLFAEPATESKVIQPPSIIIPSKLTELRKTVQKEKGDYGSRRLERAADEIPNLDKLYKEQALREAFLGDNAKAVMTMNPRDFENYSHPLDPRFMDANSTRHTTSGERLPYPEYMSGYLPNVGAFNDVPYLLINKEEQGLPLMPFISGHEGRHRSRVMAGKGEKSGLVQLSPRAELREPFPRRSQEEYIEALKRELEMTDNMVLPEGFDRPPLKLPDIYADGGLAMAKGGKMVKGLKRLFSDPAESSTASRGTRKFEDGAGGLNIVKETGGNWLTGGAGSVERALKPLKRDEFIDVPQLQNPATAALNKWIDSNLTNYVKKQMGTADDPVRKLAEQDVVHIPSNEVGVNRYKAKDVRAGLGMPQLGKSEAAKAWEDSADYLINVAPASKHTKPLSQSEIRQGYRSTVEENPWLEKVAPDTPIYAAKSDIGSDLGFDHIMDVLRQDIAAGRIRPEQLNKVSMEQAVRRTYEYDQEMAKRMRDAQIKVTEGMPTHKDYADKGYKWIELTKPDTPTGLPEGWSLAPNSASEKTGLFRATSPTGETVLGQDMPDLIKNLYTRYPDAPGNPRQQLETALKYEGDTMGHCVGSYCDDVASGKSRIYSLRDAKGEPHVTIEVEPQNEKGYYNSLNPDKRAELMSQAIEYRRQTVPDIDPNKSPDERAKMLKDYLDSQNIQIPSRIKQIKGKQNRAPNEEYVPFVQDFVRSGEWSDVGDLSNTGLIPANAIKAAGHDMTGYDQKYFTNQEYVDFLSKKHEDFLSKNFKPSTEGMAEGGGAFKTLRFDNGGIASPDENLTYESKPSRFSKVASEMYEDTKQSLANDYERLKNSGRARAQLAKIAALQMAGGAPDLAHLGVDFVLDPLKSVTVDKLFTKPRPRSVLEGPAKAVEKRDRVPMFGSIGEAMTTKDGLPMGGSEHLIKRAQEAGLMYGKSIPIYDSEGNLAIDPETDEPYESRSGRFSLPTEIGGAILGGGALSKMRKVAGKKYQKFAEPRVDPAGALSRAIRADSDAMFNQNLRAR